MKYVGGKIMKNQVKKEKHLNSLWDNCLIIEFFLIYFTILLD